MPLAGVGVDIVDIARMERVIERTPAFRRRVFTDAERAYCDRRVRPAQHYAARFAAREAVLKALGIGFGGGVGVRDVSVESDESGRPLAVLAGGAARAAEEQGVIQVAVSLSFTHEVAVANAVALREETRPRERDARDARRALEADFRDARRLVDELERVQEDEAGLVPEAPRGQGRIEFGGAGDDASGR